MYKFGRNYKLTVQVDDEGTEVVVRYPLTLEFNVRREILSSAGTANFRIYNLSAKNRNQIYKPITEVQLVRTVKLEAGYGNDLSVIFDGFITEAKSYKQEGQTDHITEITSYDYAPGMPDKRSNWSVQAPSNTKEYCIRRIITQDLKAPIGAIGSFLGIYARNPAFCEPAWEALKKVTDGKCFFDNGKVFCLNRDDVFEATIPLINSDSGLLGSPKINGIHVVFDMLFEPRLRNGQKIELQSTIQPRLNGTYKVIGLNHSGVISGAIGGKCKTEVILMLGNYGQDEPFTVVVEE